MPTVKPSDKSGHEGEWWKKDNSDREVNDVDADYGQHADEAEKGKNMFDESQKPVHYPASG